MRIVARFFADMVFPAFYNAAMLSVFLLKGRELDIELVIGAWITFLIFVVGAAVLRTRRDVVRGEWR